ncbi:alpha/beta hydrolase [Pseudoblastomonas halimionae]|uniref:HTH luxR-type domain-containing protein n=1 Tax=Alteriqipengyuania halimionae TaxID=1926630 RepID=A0A6I4U683_9SPHN|nr:alpha/beta hydrolase [Alteriqipengyuania halimionae]MXP11216.1 hypothetical protein [Alteriqipengyuania halimionae]
MIMPQRELDLDILSASWRSLTDADGYDRMLAAWDRKITAVGVSSQGFFDRILSRQLMAIDDLLSSELELKIEDLVEAAVRNTPVPAMVLSPEGRVVTLNVGADAFYGVTQGAMAGTEWLREDSHANFTAVRSSAQGLGNTSYAIVRVVDCAGNEHLAEVYSLDVRGHERAYTVIRSLELEWYPEVSANLSQAFGLTEAETEVCRLLFRHRELDGIVAERGSTTHTIRSQIKQIFAKTEVASRVDLVRMLGLLCARAALGRDAKSMQYVDPLGNERILHRSDRRRLAYTWTGAEAGRPILFVHGEIPYFALPETTREMLVSRNIKLICLSMPGHGNSDGTADLPQIEDGVAAIAELCEHLGLARIGGLASYSGQFCLSRAAADHPKLFSALMIIGFPWNLSEGRWRRMPLTHRTLCSLILNAPPVFELVARIAQRRMLEEGPDFYLHRAFAEVPPDMQSVRDPEIQALLRPACRHLANQGHMAYVREETMVASHGLSEWFWRIEVPVHYLIPAEAENACRADCADLKALGANVTAEAVASTGELLPYQSPALFADRMAALGGDDPAADFAQLDGCAILP